MNPSTRSRLHLEQAEDLLNRRDPGSLQIFQLAEACGADPDRCAAGRWMANMFAGDFASAWRESDAIRLRGGPDPHRMWTGESLKDRHIIVRCLHGYGDAIQCLRYAPRLRSLGRGGSRVGLRLVAFARFVEDEDTDENGQRRNEVDVIPILHFVREVERPSQGLPKDYDGRGN